MSGDPSKYRINSSFFIAGWTAVVRADDAASAQPEPAGAAHALPASAAPQHLQPQPPRRLQHSLRSVRDAEKAHVEVLKAEGVHREHEDSCNRQPNDCIHWRRAGEGGRVKRETTKKQLPLWK